MSAEADVAARWFADVRGMKPAANDVRLLRQAATLAFVPARIRDCASYNDGAGADLIDEMDVKEAILRFDAAESNVKLRAASSNSKAFAAPTILAKATLEPRLGAERGLTTLRMFRALKWRSDHLLDGLTGNVPGGPAYMIASMVRDTRTESDDVADIPARKQAFRAALTRTENALRALPSKDFATLSQFYQSVAGKLYVDRRAKCFADANDAAAIDMLEAYFKDVQTPKSRAETVR